MIMWLMSDRAIPRSYRMMEGFGVHTFRFINARGESNFIKFHWKPMLGVHSVAWDEAQNISGKDPDFHRRDLWEAIESGAFPEWELGVQVIPEADEFKYEFDLLDSTKIVPEELVPVLPIGKMTLNRNPDNFFAETEQVAFHIGNIVPGIDFTNDPLLQGRLFSYTDTQLIRLGGPNFHEIPINRPINPSHNNQRDGFMRQRIDRGKTSYGPNSLGDNYPLQVSEEAGGFKSYQERIDARKVRARSDSFRDHFSQAQLFYNSQSEPERNHIIDAFSFELGKVKAVAVRQRMIGILSLVDKSLAGQVAIALGLQVQEKLEKPINKSLPADANPSDYEPIEVKVKLKRSAALSMEDTVKSTIISRKIAVLAADGVDASSLKVVTDAIRSEGGIIHIISPKLGQIMGSDNKPIQVEESFLTAASVLYDAIYLPGGKDSVNKLQSNADAVHFLNEAFKHCKAIAADTGARLVLDATYFFNKGPEFDVGSTLDEGIIIESDSKFLADKFIKAIAKHRFWEREKKGKVPA